MKKTLKPVLFAPKAEEQIKPKEATSLEVGTAIVKAQLDAYDWKSKPLPEPKAHSRMQTVILEHDPITFGISESGHYCVENERNGFTCLYQDVGMAITEFVVLSYEELGVWLHEKIDGAGLCDPFGIPEYKKLRIFGMKRMDAVNALLGRPPLES